MALMKFREPNQVRRVGVRPAHDGTQVLERGSADNATVVLYTVPAGKVFYLCHAWLNVQGVAAGSVYLAIYDGVPAVWRLLYTTAVPINTFYTVGEGNYYPPIEIPTTYSLRINSVGANCTARGLIHGWVE